MKNPRFASFFSGVPCVRVISNANGKKPSLDITTCYDGVVPDSSTHSWSQLVTTIVPFESPPLTGLLAGFVAYAYFR